MVRGPGAMIAFDTVKDHNTYEPDAGALLHEARSAGADLGVGKAPTEGPFYSEALWEFSRFRLY